VRLIANVPFVAVALLADFSTAQRLQQFLLHNWNTSAMLYLREPFLPTTLTETSTGKLVTESRLETATSEEKTLNVDAIKKHCN
jgi:hypothetical protein